MGSRTTPHPKTLKPTWIPKVYRTIAFLAVCRRLEFLFYMFSGFRQTLSPLGLYLGKACLVMIGPNQGQWLLTGKEGGKKDDPNPRP